VFRKTSTCQLLSTVLFRHQLLRTGLDVIIMLVKNIQRKCFFFKKVLTEILKSITQFFLIHMDILTRQINIIAKKPKSKSNRHMVNKAHTHQKKKTTLNLSRGSCNVPETLGVSASYPAPGAMVLVLLLYSLCPERW